MKKLIINLFSIILFIGALGPVKATLLGDTVSCSAQGYYCSRDEEEVGGGPEFHLAYGDYEMLSIDIGASEISIQNVFPHGTREL